MIFMNHKIKSFLVAVTNMKAIAAAVCPLRASAWKDWHAREQFCILEQVVTIARKMLGFSYTSVSAIIKITLWSPLLSEEEMFLHVHCVVPFCERKHPFVSSFISPPHSLSNDAHCPECHLSFSRSFLWLHSGSLAEAGKKHEKNYWGLKKK